jgi:hypothetical protein
MDNKDLNFDFEIKKEDFAFVQQDKKISDKKLETKPTTFAKDAFKRFCNKTLCINFNNIYNSITDSILWI